MGKLPSDVRLQIARVTTCEVWDVEELLQVIKREVEAREISEGVKIHETKNIDSNKRNFPPTASALVVRDSRSSGTKKCCVYCKGDHYSASCERVNSRVNRREVLMKEGRCFLCLSSGHRANQCNSTRRCRKCNRRHHQSICKRGTTQHVGTEDTQDTAPKTTVAIGKSKSNMLLQTARTFAYSVNEELMPVRVLMDNRSQRSYVTNSLSARLGLRPLKRERLTLNTFGSTNYNKKDCNLVQVRLQGKLGNDIEILALGFPTICSPLQTPVAVSQYPHLQGLELADDNLLDHNSDCIDVLIGSDHYWDIVTGNIIKGSDGPVAVSSNFGWLLSGPLDNTKAGHAVSNLVIEGVELEVAPSQDDSILSLNLRQFW